MVGATFNDNPCYSPINDSDQQEDITFNNELSYLARYIPKKSVQIIGRDMNT